MSGRGKEERGRHKGLERIKTRKNKEKIPQLAERGGGVLVKRECWMRMLELDVSLASRSGETRPLAREGAAESLVINAACCDL